MREQAGEIPSNRRFRLLRDDATVTYILALPVVVIAGRDSAEAELMTGKLTARASAGQALFYAIKDRAVIPWPYDSPLLLVKASNGAVYHLSDVYYHSLQPTNAQQRHSHRTIKLATGDLVATGEIQTKRGAL